jgi:hypothetical protein
MVAGDAARALGALRQRASPSVCSLVKTLSHENPTSAFTRRRPWRPGTSPQPWAIRFPVSDGRRPRPSEALARPRTPLCRS